eukprot:TRINITY_DN27029_c0_g1_i1.p1 TRINITY_DN27029_c0_g1~~TRINITY_DN27029_c0_g1_i1.p1  ORF type:complete len:187 (-),score=18.75 TRINITY_DN27029_c0_g1_i1:25-585(-)
MGSDFWLAPDVLQRAISFLDPFGALASVATLSRHCRDVVDGVGPHWCHWLDQSFAVRLAEGGGSEAKRRFYKLAKLSDAAWISLPCDGDAPTAREWFSAVHIPCGDTLLYGGRQLRHSEPHTEHRRSRALPSDFFDDLWRCKQVSEQGPGGSQLTYCQWEEVETAGESPDARAHHNCCLLRSRYFS